MGKVNVVGGNPNMNAPVTGIVLGNLAEGSIVKINESGSPVDFYVAKHDYEPVLNGTGRTLLVRKDVYDTRAWASSGINKYASSSISAWLNDGAGLWGNPSYMVALLDEKVQEAIGVTTFYASIGGSEGDDETTVTTIQKPVFLLSLAEYGLTHQYANIEGSELPTADILRVAYLNGTATAHWTRSSTNDANGTGALQVTATGTSNTAYVDRAYGSRPAFTLPATTLFDEETMTIKEVS